MLHPLLIGLPKPTCQDQLKHCFLWTPPVFREPLQRPRTLIRSVSVLVSYSCVWPHPSDRVPEGRTTSALSPNSMGGTTAFLFPGPWDSCSSHWSSVSSSVKWAEHSLQGAHLSGLRGQESSWSHQVCEHVGVWSGLLIFRCVGAPSSPSYSGVWEPLPTGRCSSDRLPG